MKDQHTKIKGYRDLSQQEIDLMNRIKDHGEKTRELLNELNKLRNHQMIHMDNSLTPEQKNESVRCIDRATAHLQTGQMWFVRAVALPDSF